MRIVYIEIEHFRGIRKLTWAPRAGVNCLIGAGDTSKTTVLDAIDLALNPRSNYYGDDTDFFGLSSDRPALITLTLADLPEAFLDEAGYGLHLRGWNEAERRVEDEPGEHCLDAISIRVTIDPDTLEARWSIFNERVLALDAEPPRLRYKDAISISSSRLGVVAEHHLSWGRRSILNQIGERDRVDAQLVGASRTARTAFRNEGTTAFDDVIGSVKRLSQDFAVKLSGDISAQLDLRYTATSTGSIALHHADVPLRTLGTGSTRLLVSALQHGAQSRPIILIDELEHGLEPHRIARLIKHLRQPDAKNDGEEKSGAVGTSQVFLTTHSPVVVCELNADELFAVTADDGAIHVRAVIQGDFDPDTVQRHMRSSPDAFLSRRILVCEGKTEVGVARGLDSHWVSEGNDSFAYQGVVPVSGKGGDASLTLAGHLQGLGYQVAVLLDSDVELDSEKLKTIKSNGGNIFYWEGGFAFEQRLFADVPWETARELLALAIEWKSADAVLAHINQRQENQDTPISGVDFPKELDSGSFRATLGLAAKKKDWFKDIAPGEQVGTILGNCRGQLTGKPLANTLDALRRWVDA